MLDRIRSIGGSREERMGGDEDSPQLDHHHQNQNQNQNQQQQQQQQQQQRRRRHQQHRQQHHHQQHHHHHDHHHHHHLLHLHHQPDASDSNCRKLSSLTQRMRAAPSGPNHVDAAYKEFVKHRDVSAGLCRSVLADSPCEACLSVVREWKACLETLVEAFRVSLADTYRSYEREATSDMVERLFGSKKFRKEAVHRMRNASVTRVLSADPQFFPRYEIRFRNYEKLKLELADMRCLLQSAESGISPSRPIEELAVAPRGDALLEFANLDAIDEPVLRFRVDSAVLADTSPIFARIFASVRPASLRCHDDDDVQRLLPPMPPTVYVGRDGHELALYRMPQTETNRLRATEMLLLAAHGVGELPVEVGLDLLVALAESCLRYKCTSPLEGMAANHWLPRWEHASDDRLVVVAYAFGARRLFARSTRRAILHLLDEPQLGAKPWPPRIRDKVWAVRCAKVAQVHACCEAAVAEYLRPPGGATRCRRGSRACDAACLGWLMLGLDERGMLPAFSQARTRSLAEMGEAVGGMGACSSLHGGVCDPVGALRAAVGDVLESLGG
ncbi:hypothetical protein GQ602_003879 [Ophiocordyceps camponoti-floridani]|uniref:BTB domain-containing protein n=1 Tax=Ophiocordyceps camponoti-floridani TaxID=2030778 RepID=A0A8H4Q5R2_9HYPO|nr:hypothetical protein GQ602_003879 [Ophiocordyceps camponoti-floridani]